MKQFLEVPVDEDHVIVFELDDVADGIVRSGRPGEAITQMTESFSSALSRFRPLAQTIVQTFHDLPEKPDEVNVTFGIRATASAGLVVAQASGEATFTVTVGWRLTR